MQLLENLHTSFPHLVHTAITGHNTDFERVAKRFLRLHLAPAAEADHVYNTTFSKDRKYYNVHLYYFPF